METSWYGLFDLDPDATLEVRAGDLQEFMRQQMMGVVNPGLVVTTPEEHKAQDSPQPERDGDEVFCTIRWSRADIVDAIENACGVRLDQVPGAPEEAEEIIDRVINVVQNSLEDRSIERGWEVIDTLMPDDAIERAMEIAPEQVPEPGKQSVREWYMQDYPTDELGADIDPDATFDDALKAVSLGGRFYDAIGVGDSIVRERIFSQLADRYGVSYDDVYEAWLHERPVEVPSAPSPEHMQGGVSLIEEATLSRQASDQLSSDGHMPDAPTLDSSERG